MSEPILGVIAATLTAATLCQWLAWRLKLPGIVFLLTAGILAGPLLGLLDPEAILGPFFFPFVSLSVAVILFEGSLTLKFDDIRGLETIVRNMVSYGMAVTWIITAVAAHYAVGLSWEISFLFGAITVVSGPTVIMPMLRTIRPTASVSNILRWEGIIIDPIGAALAVLVYEFIISGSGQQAMGHTLLTFGRLVSVGALVGVLGGYSFGLMIRNSWLPLFLHNLGALTLVIVSFIGSDMLQPESGLVAVTIMGIWLANMRDVAIEEILDFKENISILLISVLFIMLSARLDIQGLINLGWGVALLFVAIQFLARPLNVMVSSLGSRLAWPERHLLAWIAPRGIVAAAIAALFSVQLEKAGISDAHLLLPLTFFVIIATVVLQSTTARPIALWLKVAEPAPNGFLIIGANRVARAFAGALSQAGLRVRLTDTGADNISKAKHEGFPVYFGNPLSEHADRHMDLAGIGRLLALSPQQNVNAAAAIHFKITFGSKNVFILGPASDEKGLKQERMSVRNQGYTVFGNGTSYAQISSVLSAQGEIRTTALTEKFGIGDFFKIHGNDAVPLFAVGPDEKMAVFTTDQPLVPEPGWDLIYLLIKNETPREPTDAKTQTRSRN